MIIMAISWVILSLNSTLEPKLTIQLEVNAEDLDLAGNVRTKSMAYETISEKPHGIVLNAISASTRIVLQRGTKIILRSLAGN